MKRTEIKKPTLEAKILRFMRQSRKLSFRNAGKLIRVSGSLINHYEHGRMDLSQARIEQLCTLYGYSTQEFAEYQSGRAIPILNVKDECFALIERISEEKLRALHAVLLGFVN